MNKNTEVLENFCFPGKILSAEPFGSGHINNTYRIVCDTHPQSEYILQRMNKSVFQNPAHVMENIMNVTEWLKRKIAEQGGDPCRETLTVIPAKDGRPYYEDSSKEYWRAYLFITGTACYDKVTDPNIFYEGALAVGRFQNMLSNYPAAGLHETIPDFHNTVKRLEALKRAIEKDSAGRLAAVSAEVDFVMEREDFAHTLVSLTDSGELPLRVTHNDTKFNNILIDSSTGKGICLIDLDTVMPGLAVNDFGDAVRSGTNTAAEDEKDLSEVTFDIGLYEAFTRGYLHECGGALTEAELFHLPTSAVLMTLECGIRFLTDYLEGDHYFKIKHPEHNLDRCKNQLKLVQEMEAQIDTMRAIVSQQKY